MKQIFVSYKTTDQKRIRPLVELLEGRGWTVWWDRKIPPGKTFDQVIEEAISAAGCMVVVWSADSVASDWVKTEAAEGMRRGILVPVLIDDAPIPLEFRRIQAAKLTVLPLRPDDPEVQGLLSSVSTTLEHAAGSRAPETTPERLTKTDVLRFIHDYEEGGAGEDSADEDGSGRWPAGRRWLAAGALASAIVLAALAFGIPDFRKPEERDFVPGPVDQPITFIGVDTGAEDELADAKIVDYLAREASVEIEQDHFTYEAVVSALANWRRSDGAYLARTTPYVYVAAKMLGAEVSILGTYQSKATGDTTYYSYFVVNRRDFPGGRKPTLDDVVGFLETKSGGPPVFIYHSRFSTSSYFQPSLFFRRHNVFNMDDSTGVLTAIYSRQIDQPSSSELVRKVARGEADLAAVWDGTMADFEPGAPGYEEFGKKVYFVELGTALPNDLLICSASLDSRIKAKIRSALRTMKAKPAEHVGVGDFLWWTEWASAGDARDALAALWRLAAGPAAPVTVAIENAEDGARVDAAYLEAARQALRLSGTELVLFDRDLHQHKDFIWRLEPIHDGALRLISEVQIRDASGADLEQEHWLTFADADELTGRISSFIQTQMHRIRYLWPYADKPTLIRDFGFSIGEGAPAMVQIVNWRNPERNDLAEDVSFETEITAADFNKLNLDFEGYRADPMSNVAYRVVLMRTSRETALLRALSLTFVALLVLAAAAAVADFALRGLRPANAAATDEIPALSEAFAKSRAA